MQPLPIFRLLPITALLAVLFLIDGESRRDQEYRLQRDTASAYRESARRWVETHGAHTTATWYATVIAPDPSKTAHHVRKWRSPVLVAVEADAASDYPALVRSLIAWAATAMPEVPLRLAAPGEDSRITITIGSGADFFRRHGRGGGSSFFYLESKPDGEIIRATIQLDPTRFSDGGEHRELSRLFIRSLGLNPVPPAGADSVFSTQSPARYPTSGDHQLLSLLYDPQLPTGILTRDLQHVLNP